MTLKQIHKYLTIGTETLKTPRLNAKWMTNQLLVQKLSHNIVDWNLMKKTVAGEWSLLTN